MMHSKLTLLLATVVVALCQLLLIWFEVTPIRNGGAWNIFWGPDSYTHLNQVIQIVLHGDWFDHVFHETNAPFGAVSHYTRILDIYLLAGALLGSLVTDFDTALHYWAIWSGPALHFAAILLLSWGTRPFLPAPGFLLLVLLLVLQRSLTIDFAAGQADHHSLLNFLMLALLLVTARLVAAPERKPLALWAGLLAALLLWVSPEGLLAVLLVLSVLALLWLWRGRRYLAALRRFTMGLALTSVIALLIEYPPASWFVAEYDRFSIVHLVLALLLWAASLILEALDNALKPQRWALKLGLGLGLSTLVGLIMWLQFPSFFAHPYTLIDPFVLDYVYSAITIEGQLLQNTPLNIFIILLEVSVAFALVLFLLWRLRHSANSEQNRTLFYLLGLLLFIPYALSSSRALPFLALVLIVPWAEAILYFWRRTLDFGKCNNLVAAAACAAGLLLFVAGNWSAALIFQAQQNLAVNFKNIPQCDYSRVAPFISSLHSAEPGKESGVLMAPMFAGSELVYRTPYAVVGSSMHGNAAGIRDGYRFFSASGNDHQAIEIVSKRDIELVLYCRNVGDQLFGVMNQNFRSLIARLFMGRPPAWLERVPLPTPIRKEFDLYRVRL